MGCVCVYGYLVGFIFPFSSCDFHFTDFIQENLKVIQEVIQMRFLRD